VTGKSLVFLCCAIAHTQPLVNSLVVRSVTVTPTEISADLLNTSGLSITAGSIQLTTTTETQQPTVQKLSFELIWSTNLDDLRAPYAAKYPASMQFGPILPNAVYHWRHPNTNPPAKTADVKVTAVIFLGGKEEGDPLRTIPLFVARAQMTGELTYWAKAIDSVHTLAQLETLLSHPRTPADATTAAVILSTLRSVPASVSAGVMTEGAGLNYVQVYLKRMLSTLEVESVRKGGQQ